MRKKHDFLSWGLADNFRQLIETRQNYILLEVVHKFSQLMQIKEDTQLTMIPIRKYITVTFGLIIGSVAGLSIYIEYIAPKWIRNRWIRSHSFE